MIFKELHSIEIKEAINLKLLFHVLCRLGVLVAFALHFFPHIS